MAIILKVMSDCRSWVSEESVGEESVGEESAAAGGILIVTSLS